MTKTGGFTLIELLVTITIGVILLTIGVPSFLEFIRNSRRDSTIFEIVATLQGARSEAVKRGARVAVCPSTNGDDCTGSNNWDSGWISYVDTNADAVHDSGEDILTAQAALPTGTTLRSTNNNLAFQSTGYAIGFSDTLRLCDARGVGQSRRIIISEQGIISSAVTAASCP